MSTFFPAPPVHPRALVLACADLQVLLKLMMCKARFTGLVRMLEGDRNPAQLGVFSLGAMLDDMKRLVMFAAHAAQRMHILAQQVIPGEYSRWVAWRCGSACSPGVVCYGCRTYHACP